MIAAQRELNRELQAERSSIDRQREGLEAERREIAETRVRDPVVAEAILSIGLLLLCLAPLVLTGLRAVATGSRRPGVGRAVRLRACGRQAQIA